MATTVPPDVLTDNDTSGIVQGVAVNDNNNYQTEFVKVYQDAGVIGVAMLTLLALCVLLGLFSLRLLKMYVELTKARDALEDKRVLFSEKTIERLMSIDSGIRNQRDCLNDMIEGQSEFRERISRIEMSLQIPYHTGKKVSRDRLIPDHTDKGED